MTRVDETWHRLREWTYGQTPSERLAAQVIQAEGYANVDPVHPLGGKDGGQDALARKDGSDWVMAVYFPRGQQEFNDIKKKVVADFAGVAAAKAHGMVFVTNQEIKKAERAELNGAVSGELDLMHIERLVTVLDRPEMGEIRQRFLHIAPGATVVARESRLATIQRSSLARCRARWMALGLSGGLADRLAGEVQLGSQPADLLPNSSERLRVWIGEFGSGKSISAERYHQASVAIAEANPDAPVPIFLHAKEAAAGLERVALDRSEGLGDPQLLGAAIVLDAVDELGFDGANQILTDARVLTATWPATTVLITGRALAVLRNAEESIEIPSLSEAAQMRCMELGADRSLPNSALDGLPDLIRHALVRPMFALLVGIWMKDRQSLPQAPVDLLAMLGERAAALGANQLALRGLALESVARDLAPVPVVEVRDDLESLVRTGLVIERADGVTFGLPAIAQWFASQAIVRCEHDIDAILSAPEDLQLWLYPFALALATASSSEGNELMAPVVDRAPGFAARVLSVAFTQAVLDGGAQLPWRAAGEQLRRAYQSIAAMLGDAARLTGRLDAQGNVRPLAVATHQHRLTVAFYTGAESRPNVFALPPGFELFDASWDWGAATSAPIGPGATWAWRWAHNAFHTDLDSLLRRRGLPIPDEGPLADEAVWQYACKVMNRSPLLAEEFDIDPLLTNVTEALKVAGDGHVDMVFGLSGAHHDARAIRDYLERRIEHGETVLQAPLPPADIEHPASGVIGNWYTEDRLVTVATELYAKAIEGYRQLVDRWFASLAEDLEHRVLMPLRVVAKLNPGHHVDYGPIPSLAGHVEALSEGEEDAVSITIDHEHYRYDVDPSIWEAQRRLRPNAARWLSGRHGGLNFELGRGSSITEAVYHWLAEDLHRLGIVGRLAWGQSNPQVRWESSLHLH